MSKLIEKKVKVKSLSQCPTICDPMDCNPPGSSVHGIFQARILDWVAISFSRDLPNRGIEPGYPALQADALPSEPSRPSFNPWVGKIPWRRKWQPAPVFWPGEFHGLYSPWGCKESDTSE